MPDSVKGISSWGTIRPTTPLAGGRRTCRPIPDALVAALDLGQAVAAEDSVRMDHVHHTLLVGAHGHRGLLLGSVRTPEGSSRKRGGLVLPIRTLPVFT